jgi:hypothetical protein
LAGPFAPKAQGTASAKKPGKRPGPESEKDQAARRAASDCPPSQILLGGLAQRGPGRCHHADGSSIAGRRAAGSGEARCKASSDRHAILKRKPGPQGLGAWSACPSHAVQSRTRRPGRFVSDLTQSDHNPPIRPPREADRVNPWRRSPPGRPFHPLIAANLPRTMLQNATIACYERRWTLLPPRPRTC